MCLYANMASENHTRIQKMRLQYGLDFIKKLNPIKEDRHVNKICI